MQDLYQSYPARILEIKDLNYNTKLFTLDFIFDFQPGQFVMVGLPGFGEAAFSLPAANQLAIRGVGGLTRVLHRLRVGDRLYLRGPYGRGYWPQIEGKILVIAGGCGIISMRPFLTKPEAIIFYGVREERDLLFKEEQESWSNLHISIEPKMITDLFDEVELPRSFKVFMCGPPVMYKFVIQRLKEFQLREEDIFVSLERRMYCGTGICQHCAIGDYYVCKDGPVFSWEQLKGQRF